MPYDEENDIKNISIFLSKLIPDYRANLISFDIMIKLIEEKLRQILR